MRLFLKQVTQDTVPLIEITPIRRDFDPADQATIEIEIKVVNWFRRITGVVGGVFLCVALVVWMLRPSYHYRFVLAFLTVAMLAAILHSYAFEDGQQL